ncbi:MAG: sigma-70 family RNA polymerase sigma factor [Verrucomicrobiales bacterium]|nr:sigma-70 family RNA polymerase sigma factor [Verrucomicrobiales bacterium]
MREPEPPGAIRPHPLFAATRWSLVGRARDQSSLALNELFTQYRQPLLTYLAARGYGHADAEDLVQGFCAHLVRRDFLATVAPVKGRFRTFLLNSFRNYLCDQYDRARAQKRGRAQGLVSLDETGGNHEPLHTPVARTPTADRAFELAWARTVLDRAMRVLVRECTPTGHGPLLEALEPTLFADATSLSYCQIAQRLGMTEGAVKTAAYRLRARLKGLIREEVLQTVGSDADWKDEVRYLITLFAG